MNLRSSALSRYRIQMTLTPLIPDPSDPLETVLQPQCPKRAGSQPAAIQRQEGVHDERRALLRRELRAHRSVQQIIAAIGDVARIDRPAERNRDLHWSRERKLLIAKLPLRDHVERERRPRHQQLVKARRGKNRILRRLALAHIAQARLLILRFSQGIARASLAVRFAPSQAAWAFLRPGAAVGNAAARSLSGRSAWMSSSGMC